MLQALRVALQLSDHFCGLCGDARLFRFDVRQSAQESIRGAVRGDVETFNLIGGLLYGLLGECGQGCILLPGRT